MVAETDFAGMGCVFETWSGVASFCFLAFGLCFTVLFLFCLVFVCLIVCLVCLFSLS